jgi:hypothetical protein
MSGVKDDVVLPPNNIERGLHPDQRVLNSLRTIPVSAGAGNWSSVSKAAVWQIRFVPSHIRWLDWFASLGHGAKQSMAKHRLNAREWCVSTKARPMAFGWGRGCGTKFGSLRFSDNGCGLGGSQVKKG